ncbi:MAG: TIGR03943 family putative permease subunit [Pseudanabaenaceae cyanobacterium]
MPRTALKPKTSVKCSPLPWLGYVDGGAILLWGILLVKLWLANQLFILIHPNYMPLVQMAGIGLLGLGGWSLWRAHTLEQGRGYAHWGSVLLLVTALVALPFNPQAFASDKAIHRGVNDLSNLSLRSAPASFRASDRPENRSTLLEWSRTLAVYPEPDAYTGQEAKVTGFVVKSDQLPSNVFLLTRFVITCCAADVYPVSLPVQVAGDMSAIQPDQWLEVEGRMFTLTHHQRRQLAIAAHKITC